MEAPETSEIERLRKRALRILGSRRLSSQEMEKRLVAKGETPEAARETVKWMEDIGVVDDVDYASAIVRHYSGKGYGTARIRDELFKRGIPRDLWDDALSGSDDPLEAACEFLEKKLRGSNDKDDLRRAADALCRRGFSYEDARRAVKAYLENGKWKMEN